MSAKIKAAMIATDSGADMVIANSKDVNIIFDILNGDNAGTLFLANKAEEFNLNNYL
jgi:glutamate 5-kinase